MWLSLARAFGWGPRGRRFKSCHPDGFWGKSGEGILTRFFMNNNMCPADIISRGAGFLCVNIIWADVLQDSAGNKREKYMEDYSNLFVCLMGVCTVFIGLICIIILVSIMSGIVRRTDKSPKQEDTEKAAQPGAAGAPSRNLIENVTPELVAAVSAVIAEEMGTDVSALRILSLKKVSA